MSMSHSNQNDSLKLPDFQQLLQELSHVVQSLEVLRLDYLQKKANANRNSLIIGLIGAVVAIVVSAQSSSPIIAAFCAVITIIVIVGYRHFAIGNSGEIFSSNLKTELYSRVAAVIAPQMVFQPGEYRSESELQQTGLISSRIDRYSGQDQFSGHVGQTALVFSEVHAERRETTTDSKGRTRTRWVTVFRGIFLTADFHKNFSGTVRIESDFAESTFGWLGRKMQGLSGDLVRLENPEFENAFKVRATDQVEARYILTPTMQERLLELQQTWGKSIMLALDAGHVHLLITNSQNWFECNPELAATDTSQLELFSKQLLSILRIIETLDLNTRLWSKE